MASVLLTAERSSYNEGETMVFRASYNGLAAGTGNTAATGPGHISATLNDGTVVEGDSTNVTVTRPGTPAQTVVSEVVTFRGRTLTKQANGTFTGLATAS